MLRSVAVCGPTLNQLVYMQKLRDVTKPIVLASGPAGSGKTFWACKVARESLESRMVQRILLTKPAVGVDEQHGFLPGDLSKKMAPWIAPMTDELRGPLLQKIEAAPLAYMRGRTFENSFVIADEMQNATPGQMKMLLTRIGRNSKLVITGDMDQHDLEGTSGFEDFVKRLEHAGELEHIAHVHLEDEDIKRHPAVVEVLRVYD